MKERIPIAGRIGISAATIAVVGLFYMLLNRLIDPTQATPLPLFIDSYIPLVPFFIVPYLLYYPLITLAPCFLETWPEIRRLLISYAIVMGISGLFYLLAPVSMIRPDLPLEGGIFIEGIRFIYSNDVPINCFPSQHAAFITAAAMAFKGKKSYPVWIVIAVLVNLSTVFVKQHWIIDTIFGAALGLFAWKLAQRH